MTIQQISENLSNGILLSLIGGFLLFAYCRKVDIFSTFTVGAKEGLDLSIKIVPYLLAFLIAIGMFRAAGGFELINQLFGPLFNILGLPKELVPLSLLRPFSASASNGLFAEIAKTYGGDSFLAHAAATIMGSTETTFYVVMVYFGAVSIRRTRHAIPAGLIADIAGVFAAVFFTRLFYG